MSHAARGGRSGGSLARHFPWTGFGQNAGELLQNAARLTTSVGTKPENTTPTSVRAPLQRYKPRTTSNVQSAGHAKLELLQSLLHLVVAVDGNNSAAQRHTPCETHDIAIFRQTPCAGAYLWAEPSWLSKYTPRNALSSSFPSRYSRKMSRNAARTRRGCRACSSRYITDVNDRLSSTEASEYLEKGEAAHHQDRDECCG